MIFTLALRSLLAHPIRSAVLACGFGLGVAVMASLLGIGEVILEQAQSPSLVGGGDVLVTGAAGQVSSARFVISGALKAPPLATRVVAASPASRANLYAVHNDGIVPIRVRGGIPSLERALGDPETARFDSWVDAPADRAWSSPDPGDVLRAMDRFHDIPDVPARAASWAEWLYFNGRAGDARFYLTFLVGPTRQAGRRIAGVRLQLDRGGRLTTYSDGEEIDEARLLAEAPDLTIGRSRVRLEGLRYHVTIDLPEDPSASRLSPPASRLLPPASRLLPPASRLRPSASGDFFLDAVSGRALPPLTIRGAAGWISGYTVPVMSGALAGALTIDHERIPLDGGAGYHDHNWGFWEGVSWQWGQVQHGGLSFVYGRVYPPRDAADPDRIPGFLAALGPDGPVGYASSVTIEESSDRATGRPQRIVVRGRGSSLDLTMELAVEDAVVTRMPGGALGGGMDFLQLRARYQVRGHAGGQPIDFTAVGAAETFRGK